MKILKKNKPWSAEVECSGAGYHDINGEKKHIPCHSVLEIEGTDIYSERITSLHSEVRYAIICPCCKSFTGIDAKSLKIPQDVLSFCDNNRIDDFTKTLESFEDNDNYGLL